MKVGETVKNGSVVIAVKKLSNKEIVLCLWNDITPYVTWNCYDNGITENGHYHRNLMDAVKEFEERI